MRISDWSSDVCSSDLTVPIAQDAGVALLHHFLHVGLARNPAPQVRRQRPAVFGEERLEGLRFARELVGGVGSAGKVYDVPHERNRPGCNCNEYTITKRAGQPERSLFRRSDASFSRTKSTE